MAFIASFIQYVVILVLLAALAVAGVFFGRFLRSKKDAKAMTSDQTKE